MPFLVLFHVCPLNTLVVTERASKGLFSCVRHGVFHQLPRLPERFRTHCALVRSLIRVLPFMGFNSGFQCCSVITIFALERLLSGVSHHVRDQLGVGLTPVVALVTGKILFSRVVYSEVGVQLTFRGESGLTLIADKLPVFVAQVGQFMCLEVPLQSISFATRLAQEGCAPRAVNLGSVSFKARSTCKSFAALAARIWLFIGVNSYMGVEF